MMIAALVQCRRAFRRAGLAADGGARVPVHRRQDVAGRPARPFLARGPAAVPRARLRPRQHDPRRARAARGDRRARLSRTRAGLAGRARPPLRQRRRPAAISSPPTMPKAWSCGRIRPATTPRPIRMGSPRRTSCGSPRFTGQHAWRDQADRLFDGLLPLAADNLFRHIALLNALDLRLRDAEIVVTGLATCRDASVETALKLPFLDRVVIRAPSADALPAAHPARPRSARQPSRPHSSARRNLFPCR